MRWRRRSIGFLTFFLALSFGFWVADVTAGDGWNTSCSNQGLGANCPANCGWSGGDTCWVGANLTCRPCWPTPFSFCYDASCAGTTQLTMMACVCPCPKGDC
jgi:hypothetical protein